MCKTFPSMSSDMWPCTATDMKWTLVTWTNHPKLVETTNSFLWNLLSCALPSMNNAKSSSVPLFHGRLTPSKTVCSNLEIRMPPQPGTHASRLPSTSSPFSYLTHIVIIDARRTVTIFHGKSCSEALRYETNLQTVEVQNLVQKVQNLRKEKLVWKCSVTKTPCRNAAGFHTPDIFMSRKRHILSAKRWLYTLGWFWEYRRCNYAK